MRGILAAAALAALACAGPTTVVRTVDTRPAIAVVGAPGEDGALAAACAWIVSASRAA